MRDPELGPALHKLRSGGKRLFLLTNSLWDYTDAVMRYLLDGVLPEYPAWRNYFDVVVTGAAKPAFFSERRPLLELSAPTARPLGEAALARARARSTRAGTCPSSSGSLGIGGDRVLYVGDHIYGDILRSKKSSLWRTCMVVEELETELAWLERHQRALEETGAPRGAAASGSTTRLARTGPALNLVERRLDRLQPGEPGPRRARGGTADAQGRAGARCAARCATPTPASRRLEQEVEGGFNRYWGLTFKEGNENSRFGEQVEDYACIYTSRVSNFVFYSPMQYFRSPRAAMPHERFALAFAPYGEDHAAPAAGDRPSKAPR